MTTETAVALGSMPNAPLVLVLAQVRFLPSSQENNLDLLRDHVCDRLGDDFPNITPVYAMNIQIANGDGQPIHKQSTQSLLGFDLRSVDLRAVVRLSSDSITLAVNSYQNIEHFMAIWSRALSSLAAGGITHVQRVGFRYVDFIYPSTGRVPEDYVVAPFDFRVKTPLPGAVGYALTNAHIQEYAFAQGRMRLQYARGMGDASLPVDLQGLLEVKSAHAIRGYEGATGILDTDRWIDGRRPSDAQSLQDAFMMLHTDVSNAFKQCTTQLAIKEWSTPRNDAA
jgi:uncharacterized protein (TIGR04255 family)